MAYKVGHVFVNENGESVRMVVTKGIVSVKIWMQSSDSVIVNKITPREAVALRDLLNEVFPPESGASV